MKVKVISVFKDKNTNEIYKIGKVLEVSAERLKEIEQYVAVIKKDKKERA